MKELLIFSVLSMPVILLSRKSLANFRSHGFYRFFALECILWLLVSNYGYWFVDALSVLQIVSWTLLCTSIYPAVAGFVQLRRYGTSGKIRTDKNLYAFERTTVLVDKGIYKYIRHPMYTSLILLTWGIFFKNITVVLFFISLLSSIFLYLTAIRDEKECISYFGEKYKDYKSRTSMFVPFLI